MESSGRFSNKISDDNNFELRWYIFQNVKENTSKIMWSIWYMGKLNDSKAYTYTGLQFYVYMDGKICTDYGSDYINSERILLKDKFYASDYFILKHDKYGVFDKEITLRFYSTLYKDNRGGFSSSEPIRLDRIGTYTKFVVDSENLTIKKKTQSTTINMNLSVFDKKLFHNIDFIASNSKVINISKKKFFSSDEPKPIGRAFSIDASKIEEIAKQYPNSVSGTGMLKIESYKDNGLNNGLYVGQDTIPVNITIDESVAPSTSDMVLEITPVNSGNITNWDLLVAGYSKAKLEGSAKGCYGSTISKYDLYYKRKGDETYIKITSLAGGESFSYTTSVINYSDLESYYVGVVDSRGRSGGYIKRVDVKVHPYSSPTVSQFSASRLDDDPTKVVVNCGGLFSEVNQKNNIVGRIYYKISSYYSWTLYGDVNLNENIVLDKVFDDSKSYNIRLVVQDAVGNSASADLFISTLQVLLDFKIGGKGIGIGKIAETDSMEVGLDAKFLSTINYGFNAKFELPIIQTGSVEITPYSANYQSSKTVWFDKGFTTIPNVVITPETNDSDSFVGLSVGDVKEGYFKINFIKNDVVTTKINWIATTPNKLN